MEEKISGPIARGAPVALPADLIESLARGERSRAAERMIASAPLELVEQPRTATKARFAPVDVDEEEMEALRTREAPPDSFAEKLERSARQTGRFGDVSPKETAKGRPELTAPRT